MAIGVPRPLALEKPQSVDLAQAARYFGAHGEPDAATLALLQKCAVPLLPHRRWRSAPCSPSRAQAPPAEYPESSGTERQFGSLRISSVFS